MRGESNHLYFLQFTHLLFLKLKYDYFDILIFVIIWEKVEILRVGWGGYRGCKHGDVFIISIVIICVVLVLLRLVSGRCLVLFFRGKTRLVSVLGVGSTV